MIKGVCVNYQCITMHEECLAGVDYSKLAGGDPIRNQYRLPCLSAWVTYGKRAGVVLSVCERKLAPTQEQIDKQLIDDTKRDEFSAKLHAILSRIKKEYKGESLVVFRDCPVCGGSGTLAISHHEASGNCRGQCSKEECLDFIE